MTARRATDDASLPPNRTLIDTATALPVGTALDAGCGEAADSLWLAERGWTVTAVDFVASALERGKSRAEEMGPDVAARIEWQEADLSTWTPPAASFDLVTTHYYAWNRQPGRVPFGGWPPRFGQGARCWSSVTIRRTRTVPAKRCRRPCSSPPRT